MYWWIEKWPDPNFSYIVKVKQDFVLYHKKMVLIGLKMASLESFFCFQWFQGQNMVPPCSPVWGSRVLLAQRSPQGKQHMGKRWLENSILLLTVLLLLCSGKAAITFDCWMPLIQKVTIKLIQRSTTDCYRLKLTIIFTIDR